MRSQIRAVTIERPRPYPLGLSRSHPPSSANPCGRRGRYSVARLMAERRRIHMRHRDGAVVVRSVHAQNAALPRAFSRLDFVSLESRQIGVLLLIGLIGIALYAFGLGRGHPIVISAVLNLDPFWAAIIAYLIAGRRSPPPYGRSRYAWPWRLSARRVAISQADFPSLSLEIIEVSVGIVRGATSS